jgi:hypothetical protein
MPSPIAASTIAAQAFRFMEMGPVSSFADDSPQAQDAAEQYPRAMGMCLEGYDWSFASTLAHLPEAVRPATLAAEAALPYLYALPGDVIVLREVGAPDAFDRPRWRLDRGFLRADAPGPLRVRYTGRIENEAILPSLFQTAVAAQLALLLAPRWLQTMSKIQWLRASLDDGMQAAIRADARMASAGRYDDRPEARDWVTEALR